MHVFRSSVKYTFVKVHWTKPYVEKFNIPAKINKLTFHLGDFFIETGFWFTG